MKVDMEGMWRRHRPFILKVSGGLVAFLVMLTVADNYADVSDQQDRNARTIENLEGKMQILNLSYHRALKKGAALDEELEDLCALVAVRGDSGVKMPEDNFLIDFPEKKKDVIDRVRTRASPLGLDIREDLSADFDLGTDLSDAEWQDRYRQLEVMRRVLNACILHAVPIVVAARPQAIDELPVPATPDRVIRRYPVQFEFSAPYEDYMALLDTFQRPGEVLSMEIQRLEPDEDEKKRGFLRGVVNFVGFDLGEVREESRKGGKGRGFNRRKRRG